MLGFVAILYLSIVSLLFGGELVCKHRISALGLLFRRFVLDHIPVFRQNAVFESHDVGNNPVRRQAGVRISPVDNDKIAFGHNQSMFVLQRRWTGFDQVEQTFATRRNVRAALDIFWRPIFLSGSVVPLVKQGVECVEDQRFVFLRYRLAHNSFLDWLGMAAL